MPTFGAGEHLRRQGGSVPLCGRQMSATGVSRQLDRVGERSTGKGEANWLRIDRPIIAPRSVDLESYQQVKGA